MLRIIPLCLVALLTTSCVVRYKKAVDSLKASAPCCRSVAEFKYDPFPPAGVANFKIDEASPAFEFPTGKSFFKAFALPERSTHYRLLIKSFALGQDEYAAHIFFPQLAVLDGRFRVLRQSDPADFRVGRSGLVETASASWNVLRIKVEGSVLIDDPRARYVVVYTTYDLLSGGSLFDALARVPVPVGLGKFVPIPVGFEEVGVRHSPFGVLQLNIVGDQPRR